MKLYEFNFFETKHENSKKEYGFKQKIRNRYNTNHKIHEWFYIGENHNLKFNDNNDYLEIVSSNYSPNIYIWLKKALHVNQKEAIVINMKNNILQNKCLKFGLISGNVFSNLNNYEQSKILQFININNSFCLDLIDSVDDTPNHKFPLTSPQFYFMNGKNGISVHFNSNKKWNSFNLPLSLNNDCFFFFEIIGLNNKINLINIHQDTYLESGIDKK